MTNLTQRKMTLIRFITDSADTQFLDEVERLKKGSPILDKNAKNPPENLPEKVFSDAMQKSFARFADMFAEYLEDNEVILKDLKNVNLSADALYALYLEDSYNSKRFKT